MGGFLWINRSLSKKIWKPFYTALNNMQQYELNKNASPAFLESNTDEFNELNQSLRHLFDRNYKIYLQQKEFTENASHEMQTPLAVFQSKLDLLMQTNPITESQAAIIVDLDNANQRLIRLNKSLLLLSKIENNQYPETDTVDILAITEKIFRQYKLHAETKDITMVTSLNGHPTIEANATLIEILIGNLVSNAIRHNGRQKKLIVELIDRTLVVKNTGVSYALDGEKIFQRFQKENSSGNNESIGLGLAIVKRICDLYACKIIYSFSNGYHHFAVKF